MSTSPWHFWIDVGGTFTDAVARGPDAEIRVVKVLSSGVTQGRAVQALDGRTIIDPARREPGSRFWTGCRIRRLQPTEPDRRGRNDVVPGDAAAEGGQSVSGIVAGSSDDAPAAAADGSQGASAVILSHDPGTGALQLDAPLGDPPFSYEIAGDEDAAQLAIRTALGLSLGAAWPPCEIRLGTTWGTNALLQRRGARTALAITRGFGDALRIGNQDRPRLFDLAIRKPEPVFESVAEIDERLTADGSVIAPLDLGQAADALRRLRESGAQSLAICLVHAWINPEHERQLERLARDAGFDDIAVSHRVAPRIKLIPRGETTVLDAYLNPVLRGCLEPLGRSTGTLRLMTSSGGLVAACEFTGKDSLLSGPAGGVIGFSRIAEQAGFSRAIGFDMGGTSTDVSRYDGRHELEYEGVKAGVRFAVPMLAIETVAAGGGSVCGFDGVQLFVGPHSAGADPGPACYGRGGPLCVTDLHLALGRLRPEAFPLPLDRTAVDVRLQAVCDELNAALDLRPSDATRPTSPADDQAATPRDSTAPRDAAVPLAHTAPLEGTGPLDSTGPLDAAARRAAYTPLRLAEGFLALANAAMSRALRKVSSAKGYDPADYALVVFGGAGGLHACALAEELGIPAIVAHPLAGVLSAYGIGLADVRRQAERPVHRPYGPEMLAELQPTFAQLTAELTAAVRAEGIAAEHLAPPIWSLDLRYRGVEGTLNIVAPADGDYAAEFRRRHRQIYGYEHVGRELEVAALRIEATGHLPLPSWPPAPCVPRRPAPASTAAVYRNGAFRPTPIYQREQLRPGDELPGPAILCEPTSTLVIADRWTGTVAARGEVILRRGSAGARDLPGDSRAEHQPDADADARVAADVARVDADADVDDVPGRGSSGRLREVGREARVAAALDPVRLELLNQRFVSIAEQMGVTLQRTAISTNVKERLDFSCALFDAAGRLVVNAPHIPVHLGAMGAAVQAIRDDNPDLQPGDVYVTNDPYRGGSHLPDVTVVTPVHEPHRGRLIGWTASRAHHAEIGGIVPGSMPPFSRSLAEEGVLIRNFRLIRGGASGEADLRSLLLSAPWPTRRIEDNLADLAAQTAANRLGLELLLELAATAGCDAVAGAMQALQQTAAAKTRRALAKLGPLDVARLDRLDDGSPIAVRIRSDGERVVIDFTGTGPVVAGNLNANRAIVSAAVMYVLRTLIAEELPLNSGVLEPATLIVPESLLNPPSDPDPRRCPAIVGGNVETSQRVVDVLLGALGLAAASQGTMNNLTFGDATFGYYETICGGSGATPDCDGADAVHTHMTNTRLTDVELLEHRYPVLVREFSIRRGSGGAGRRRGGDGVVRRIEFLRPLQAAMLSQRRAPLTPFGLSGGGPGASGRNSLRSAADGTDRDLGGCFQIAVQAGDELTIATPGGGAYGPR